MGSYQCVGSCARVNRGTPAAVSSSKIGSIGSQDRGRIAQGIISVDQFWCNWEKFSGTVDSGAMDSIIADGIASGVHPDLARFESAVVEGGAVVVVGHTLVRERREGKLNGRNFKVQLNFFIFDRN